jgi:hypothetical protein
MKNVALVTRTLALALCGAGHAMAGSLTLIDLINAPVQALNPYNLAFIATGTSSDISFAGYQVPADETASDISLNDTSTPGPNILGQVWSFTPAASGSHASQYSDSYGTGTNVVDFGGMTLGSSDTFDQIVSTVPGDRYALTFLFTEYNQNDNEFTVSATNASAATGTPEPASMFLFGSGLLGLAIAVRTQKRRSLAYRTQPGGFQPLALRTRSR